MMTEKKIKRSLALLIGLSALVRLFLAWTLELGNDEVYYWTYALYPDFSHFDHPPMVGFVIQFFSLDMLFDSELFLRLGSVILGSVNCWLIYLIGKQIKNPLTGLYAALLYTFSIYGFVITGIFILPDTPQMFFWFLSLLFIIKSFSVDVIDQAARRNMIIAGIFIGLAMLSKYTSVFIWTGLILYILFCDRKWLRSKSLYLSISATLILFAPVIYWNIRNNFISFSFQSERVDVFASSLRLDYFTMEILGELLYNNPVNYILIILSIYAISKNRHILQGKHIQMLLFISLPLIFIFIIFSIFRRTLPHWTAPGFTTLLLIAGAYLSNKQNVKSILPSAIKLSGLVLFFVVLVGYLQIQFGIIHFPETENAGPHELGENDLSLEIFGWKQIGTGFSEILKRDREEKIFSSNPVMITYRWFPAANLDYYVAYPNKLTLLALGSIGDTHKYHWINQYRGGFWLGMDAYYITTSYNYRDPNQVYSAYFDSIGTPDTIKILRYGNHVMNAFVYRMNHLNIVPVEK